MGKNYRKFLLLFCIVIFTLTGCQMNEIKVNDEQLGIIENDGVEQEENFGGLINESPNDENTSELINGSQDNENTSDIENEKEENVTIKILNDEQINSLKSAEMLDFSKNKKMEFFTLKPSEEKTVNLNGKEVTLDMKINEYSVRRGEGALVNYFAYSYIVGMRDYNATKGSFIEGLYYDYFGFFSGKAINSGIADYKTPITQIDIEPVIKEIGIKIGVLKDVVNDKDYLVCYVEEAGFCADVFYIYDDKANLIYKGTYDWYFNNIISEGNTHKPVYAIEFYENQIICYDMYMDFEKGEEIKMEKEIVDVEGGYNKVHEITIENGIVKDKIIKIYDKIHFGETI